MMKIKKFNEINEQISSNRLFFTSEIIGIDIMINKLQKLFNEGSSLLKEDDFEIEMVFSEEQIRDIEKMIIELNIWKSDEGIKLVRGHGAHINKVITSGNDDRSSDYL